MMVMSVIALVWPQLAALKKCEFKTVSDPWLASKNSVLALDFQDGI